MSVVDIQEKKLEPDAYVIKALEGFLADAKSGKLRGFTAVFCYQGRNFQTAIGGEGDLADQLYQLKALEIRLLKLKGLL